MTAIDHHLPDRPRRVLAIASAGGHWAQLMLLREALAGHDVTYATTLAGLAEQESLTAHLVPDSNRNTAGAMVRTAWAVIRLVATVRPDIVVSTGALPGLMAVVAAKLLGCRAVWIESIANADRLSLSGRIARRIANDHFVQWPDLAARVRSRYAGALL